MSTPDREREVRRAVQAMVDAGKPKTQIQREADLSRNSIDNFLKGEAGDYALHQLDRWVRGRWTDVEPEREFFAAVLRWFADLLERGETFPPDAIAHLIGERDPTITGLDEALGAGGGSESPDGGSE